MTADADQVRDGEAEGEPSVAGYRWLSELLAWPGAGSFLSAGDIERWGELSRGGWAPEDGGPDLELVLALASRPQHWRWMGIALLALPSVAGRLGPAVRKLGMKGLRRLFAMSGRVPVGLGDAIASTERQLLDGTPPQDIDFSEYAASFKSWQGDGLRFALAVLGHVNRPAVKVPIAPTGRQVSSGSTHRSSSAPALAGYLASRSNLPDLPLADIREVPAFAEVPRSGDDQAGWTSKDFGDSLIYENWVAGRCIDLHLAGALIPGTDRAYTRGEVLSLGERLEQVMVSAGRDTLLYLTALSYSISLVTAQPRQSVVGAMARLATGRTDSPVAAWLEQGRFHVRVPASGEFGKVPKSAVEVYLPCLQDFWLPLPAVLAERLADLGRHDQEVWSYSQEGWDIHFDRLKSHLKASTARFSEVRLRNVLPVAIWMRAADIVKAQIITGQLLDHPGAALHYYAFLLRELEETYRESIAPWLPTAWGFQEEEGKTGTSDQLVGAPRASIADSALKSAIDTLTRRCERGLVHGDNDLHGLVRAYNAMVTLTVGMFAEAVANRLTFHLGFLCRRDFVLPSRDERRTGGGYAGSNGLVVFTDKHSDHGLSFRAAALPSVVVQQLLALLDFTAYLATRFLDFPDRRETSRALQRILSGDRAIFQRFKLVDEASQERGYRLVRFKRRDFANLWPELPIPVEHLRHRFTTVARQSGVSPADIRIQMGHSVDFIPFGAADPESPLEFVKRIAPCLNEALEREGWRAIGVSSFDNAPDLAPLAAGEVLRLDALLQKRLDRRWGRYRQVIARESSHFRAEFQAASAAIGEGRAVSGSAVLSAGDVSSIERKLRKQYADTGRWPAVSQAFRIWVRQEVASGNIRASIPRTTFYRGMQAPVITPAVTRAYHSACALLQVAEQLDTSFPRGELKSEFGATKNQLAVAVVELSVRAGLTRSDRLLDGIQALVSADSYDDRADRIVVRIAIPAAVQLGAASPSASHENYSEGFVLTASAALLALSWKAKFGPTKIRFAEDSVRKAVGVLLVSGKVDKSTRQTPTLEGILAVAALARRLTVAGVRSAFEEGRIRSRSFDPFRQRVLREGTWQSLSAPSAVGGKDGSHAVVYAGSAGGGDKEFVLEMRRKLHHWLRLSKKLTHDEIAGRLESSLSVAPASGGTSAVFVRLVVQWLRGDQLAWRRRSSTVYTYLTLLVTPIFASLDGRDLLQLDAEEIEEIVQRIFFSKRVGNHQRMQMILGHFLRVIEELGGARLEDDPFSEWESAGGGDQAKPYCLSVAEQKHTMSQLDHWRDVSSSVRGSAHEATFRPSNISMARYLFTCAQMGMRVGESESRLKTDLLQVRDGWVLMVRPRRRSPLKTLASYRALTLENHLSESDAQVILDTFSGMKDSESKLAVSDAANVASAALQAIAQKDSARLQACRHAVACAGFQAIWKKGDTYLGLPEPKWLAAFSDHPPAIQLLALARTLGHATPITTLSHYVHLLGYGLEQDEGWPVPEGRGYAAIALMSHGAFRTRLSRAKKGFDTATVGEMIAVLGLTMSSVSRTHSDVFEPQGIPAVSARRSSMQHQQLGRLLLDIAEGASAAALLAEHGVDMRGRNDLAEEILILQEHYRYHLFDEDLKVRARVPRWNSLQHFISRCDVVSRDESRWDAFLAVLKRQTRLSSQLRIRGGDLITTTQEILESIFHVRATLVTEGKDTFSGPSVLFRQGEVEGLAKAPIVFTYFVVLLANRLNEHSG